MTSRTVRHASGLGLTALLALQTVLAVRVILRLLAGRNHRPITPVAQSGEPEATEGVCVLVPVLDEERRLAPCLAGLIAQGPSVTSILVIDGGSRDGTVALAERLALSDARIHVIDAAPVPDDWNGKAWNLQRGLAEAGDAPWILTIDADVRPRVGLVETLVAEAERASLDVLSAATRQRLSGAAEGLVHPALLTSLVYRYGIPGGTTSDPAAVQANGQCMLFRRQALAAADGFASGRHSLCEDVTVARRIAARGGRVAFRETGDLVDVEMYAGAAEAWRNWPRSLTMRDQYAPGAVRIRLAEVALVQALPLVVTVVSLIPGIRRGLGAAASESSSGAGSAAARRVELLLRLNRGLLVMRLGMLAGMSRAYVSAPWTYWLSPLLDVPVAVRLIGSATRRRHTWRGRVIERR